MALGDENRFPAWDWTVEKIRGTGIPLMRILLTSIFGSILGFPLMLEKFHLGIQGSDMNDSVSAQFLEVLSRLLPQDSIERTYTLVFC